MVAIRNVADAQALRREIYSKSTVARRDLATLVEAARAGGGALPDDFVVLMAEVATDLLVNQADPPKYIQGGDAAWFTALFAARPALPCRAEWAVLREVIRHAVSAPAQLVEYAVDAISHAIVEGRVGPDGATDHPAGVVTSQDVAALKDIVFAAVEGSALRVTRHSAGALFRIAHATSGSGAASGFDDLFAKAVGNHLMAIAFNWTPSAADERRLGKWLDEKPSFSGFLRDMVAGGRSDAATPEEELYRRENAFDVAEQAVASRIDAEEAEWIMAHLSRDGALTPAETRLLAFIAQEATAIPDDLRSLIDRRAA